MAQVTHSMLEASSADLTLHPRLYTLHPTSYTLHPLSGEARFLPWLSGECFEPLCSFPLFARKQIPREVRSANGGAGIASARRVAIRFRVSGLFGRWGWGVRVQHVMSRW